eukprot:2365724-Alexandrium_andersonii.AAC.1
MLQPGLGASVPQVLTPAPQPTPQVMQAQLQPAPAVPTPPPAPAPAEATSGGAPDLKPLSELAKVLESYASSKCSNGKAKGSAGNSDVDDAIEATQQDVGLEVISKRLSAI